MILVLVEVSPTGEAAENSLEAITFARDLAAAGGGIPIDAVVVGMPGDDVVKALADHGVRRVHALTGPAYDAARSAFRDAWDGTEPIDMGMGGSIPFIAEFAAAFPDATILVTGVEDPGTQAHSVNESLHLGVLQRAATAEALLLARLGG